MPGVDKTLIGPDRTGLDHGPDHRSDQGSDHGSDHRKNPKKSFIR